MSQPLDTLLDFLRTERARGVEHVFLDEETKQLLRDLHRRSKGGDSKGGDRSGAARPAAPAAAVADRDEAPGPDEPAGRAEAAVPEALGATAEERIESLKTRAKDWPAARALGTLRETMVFSTGSPEAELMLVGEAPGYHEEREQEPFVGPAGQKLNDILKAMGLARESVYISNIVKFRPAMAKQTTNNRKPTVEEMASCLPFIREEVKVVAPKCIVALGATAAEGLLGQSGSVGRMRGRWHDFEGTPVRVTYHPAYLLHGSAGLKDKRMIWEDMLDVMERLELPISEKQRGFFLPKS